MNDARPIGEENSRLRALVGAAVVAAAALVGGCNTMEGAGEDVEEAGEAIEDAADGD